MPAYANFTFGGGSATVAVIHRELLDRRGWLSLDKFTLSFALARLTPGTNILAFCTGVGWLLRGSSGAVVALLTGSIPCTLMVVVATALFGHWLKIPAIEVLLLAAMIGALLPQARA